MPLDPTLRKVLVIGSGPIVIGQAAEFDFSGSQACKAAREEGVHVVLLNSNPATIQSDREIADTVYIEPMDAETVRRIIVEEKIDGIFSGMGGQTALNLCSELSEKSVLSDHNVRLLGSNQAAISASEDRELFREAMIGGGLPVAKSFTCTSLADSRKLVEELGGYPVMIRSAYTLGGTGSGIVRGDEELEYVVGTGLASSRIGQVIVEESILNWEEYEYEVVRDSAGNCIIICSMENLDPMGIHTGESIVVAPAQTLSDREHQMLRSSALRIVELLGIEGACNVQFAVHPRTREFRVVEVNPRVSRSSALASKATGYPIARIAAKIALGLRLDEIENAITRKTMAAFEPALDYVVVKIPRWPFDKFRLADRRIGTQMKSTGETMAIGRSFEEAMLKALRSLETGLLDLETGEVAEWQDSSIVEELRRPSDRRVYAVIEALRRSFPVARIRKECGWNAFFLHKMEHLVRVSESVRLGKDGALAEALQLGFSPDYIARLTGKAPPHTKCYRMVDTCAAEFEAHTPYYYGTTQGVDEVRETGRKGILIIGGGPIRIGQGIEFDYCCVHAALTSREEGYDAIIVNNNPETVSTDFDLSSRLYFEPLTRRDIMDIVDRERPFGVMTQFGGQTALNAAMDIGREPLVNILGTPLSSLVLAGNRKKFSDFVRALGLEQPASLEAFSAEEAMKCAGELSYPLILRPSHIIGGRGMEIVFDEAQMKSYLGSTGISRSNGLLIERYLSRAVEVDVDVVSDGSGTFIGGILEHVEAAGVHSGDATMVMPPQTLSREEVAEIERQTLLLTSSLQVKGLANYQFAVREGRVFVLEANPRASRTVPFVSKATGIPLSKIATKAILGHRLDEFDLRSRIGEKVAVKVSVFPFLKLRGVDSVLGPEMKSTGEVMSIGRTYAEAAWKGFTAAGYRLPTSGSVYMTVRDADKEQLLPVASKLMSLGFGIYATRGTQEFLERNGIRAERAYKLSENLKPDAIGLMRSGNVSLVINTPRIASGSVRDGSMMRRVAVETGIPLVTTISGAKLMAEAIEFGIRGEPKLVRI